MPAAPVQGDGSHLPHGSVTGELVRLRARCAALEAEVRRLRPACGCMGSCLSCRKTDAVLGGT